MYLAVSITVSTDTKNDLSGILISFKLFLKEENRIGLRTSNLDVTISLFVCTLAKGEAEKALTILALGTIRTMG